jgi:Uma2 family endonuclease
MPTRILRRRFTVEEFHQMAQAGILNEDDRVELIEGEIVEMTPISSRHAACVDRLNRLFALRFGEATIVRVQSPIRLGELSEPQPDLALLKLRPDFYAAAHPGPEDALLLVEVAETSSDYDRQVKIPLYAQADIPEVWLVDLQEEIVEIYRKPSPQGYGEVRQTRRGQLIPLEAFPDLELAVDEILG